MYYNYLLTKPMLNTPRTTMMLQLQATHDILHPNQLQTTVTTMIQTITKNYPILITFRFTTII